MTTPHHHRFISRTEWDGAAELSNARIIAGIDPGTCGAIVLLERLERSDPESELSGGRVVAWGSWQHGAINGVVDLLGTVRQGDVFLPDGSAVVVIEEPFFARSGASSIVQGWDAGWTAAHTAVQLGASHVVRVAAEVWQSEMLGPVPKGTEDKRAARKAAAIARLPARMAEAVSNRAEREALADAFGLASWALLL